MEIMNTIKNILKDKQNSPAHRYVELLTTLSAKGHLTKAQENELADAICQLNLPTSKIEFDVKAMKLIKELEDWNSQAKAMEQAKHDEAQKLAKIIEDARQEIIRAENQIKDAMSAQLHLSSKYEHYTYASNLLEFMHRITPYLQKPEELAEIQRGEHKSIKGFDVETGEPLVGFMFNNPGYVVNSRNQLSNSTLTRAEKARLPKGLGHTLIDKIISLFGRD